MRASAKGTQRYVARYPAFRGAAFYRPVFDLQVSSLGIGTRDMSAETAAKLPRLATNAKRAIQFARSTAGISVALVGMGRREHVAENVGVAALPPLRREAYQRLYRQ